jgi:hypothetical protein
MIPTLVEERRLSISFISVFSAFIGSVEQNLLGLPAMSLPNGYRHLTEEDLEYAIEYLETARSGASCE